MRQVKAFAALAALLAAAALLGGCARYLDTQVTSLTDWPEHPAGKTISIIGASPEISESLLFRRARGRFAAEFERYGIVPVPDNAHPRYVAVVDFRIGDGQTEIRELSQPVFGVIGYTTVTKGSRSSLVPTFGVIGYEYVPISVVSYTSALMLYIHDTRRPKHEWRVYEGRVTARGSCGRLDVVLPDMITALFRKFPDQSGRVRIKSELKCD